MILLLLLVVVGVVDLTVFLKLSYIFRLLRFPQEEDVKESNLPTVSICISARNETHAMTQCLERVVATEYPKLEIIVLDDGSRDDTSLLIKSFAHAGVRFIEGRPLPEGWLGKNYAQSILANEASGEYIFFMDVDTLIERRTLTQVVGYMMRHKAKMVSVIPIRNDHWATSTLMTTMRHFWTTVRFTPNHPRAASNAWLIERQAMLSQLETDTSLQTSMLMETSIARKLAQTREFRLAISNTRLGIRYEKRYSSQIETSIRLLYPQSDAYLLQVLWMVALLLVTLIPYAVLFWQPLAWAFVVIQFAIAYYYLTQVWVRYRLIGALLLPITIAQEIGLHFLSYYHYKRGSVTWKGRPVAAKPVSKSV